MRKPFCSDSSSPGLGRSAIVKPTAGRSPDSLVTALRLIRMPVSGPAPSTAFAALSSAAALFVTVSICNLLHLSRGLIGAECTDIRVLEKTEFENTLAASWQNLSDGRSCLKADCLGSEAARKVAPQFKCPERPRGCQRKECDQIGHLRARPLRSSAMTVPLPWRPRGRVRNLLQR